MMASLITLLTIMSFSINLSTRPEGAEKTSSTLHLREEEVSASREDIELSETFLGFCLSAHHL